MFTMDISPGLQDLYGRPQTRDERIDELLAANNALLKRAREAEGRLRQRRINWPALIAATLAIGLVAGGAWQGYADWRAVETAKIAAAVERETKEQYRMLFGEFADGMVKQAKRAEKAERELGLALKARASANDQFWRDEALKAMDTNSQR